MGTILIPLGISIVIAIITFLIIASSNKKYQKESGDKLEAIKSLVSKLSEEHLKTSELAESNNQELKSMRSTLEGLSSLSIVIQDKIDKIDNTTKEKFNSIVEDIVLLKNHVEEQGTILSNEIEQESKSLNETITRKISEIEKTNELKISELNKLISEQGKLYKENDEKIKKLDARFEIKLNDAIKTNKDGLKNLKDAFLDHLKEITDENEKNVKEIKSVFNSELNNINALNDKIQDDFNKYKNFSSSQLFLADKYFTVLSKVVSVQVTKHISELSSKLRLAEAEMAEIQEWHFLRTPKEKENQITNQNTKINSIRQELEDFYGYIRNLSTINENKKIGNVSR